MKMPDSVIPHLGDVGGSDIFYKAGCFDVRTRFSRGPKSYPAQLPVVILHPFSAFTLIQALIFHEWFIGWKQELIL